jgi:hypothetical protein
MQPRLTQLDEHVSALTLITHFFLAYETSQYQGAAVSCRSPSSMK